MNPLSPRAVPVLALAAAILACAGPVAPERAGLQATAILAPSDEFVRRWNAAPVGVPPAIESLEATAPDRQIFIGCVVHGYALDENGFANLRVDLELSGPAGAPILQESGFAAYDRKPEPGRTTVLVYAPKSLTLEAGDPPGTYSIRLRVTDLVSGATTEARSGIALGA